MNNRIGALVVTYNRIECLKKVLQCYSESDVKPDYVMVLDNASRKDTYDFLEEWKNIKECFNKIVIHVKENQGSSKGFSIALNEYLKYPVDWIFLADDDAYPTKETIGSFLEYIKSNKCDDVAAICAKVLNHKCIDVSHRRRTIKRGVMIKSIPVSLKEYDLPFFELDEFSYVGTGINVNAINKCGVTKDDLYIFYDDTEHSLRLRQYGKILCVPSIVIIHDKNPKKSNIDFQTYYYIRNRGWLIDHYFGRIYRNFYILNIYLRNICFISAKIKNYSAKEIKLYKDALFDLKHGKLGINELYLPGWER